MQLINKLKSFFIEDIGYAVYEKKKRRNQMDNNI